MTRRLRSTLRGVWWKRYLRSYANCYRCGGDLDKRWVRSERARRLVCRRCGVITYVNPKVVAGFIPVTSAGHVVLLRRAIEPAIGRWTYPAGFQEMGESVSDAAVRETWEEIRVRVSAQSLVGVYGYADAGVVTIVYMGRLRRGEHPRPGDESQDVGVFPPSKIPWNDLAFQSTTDALKDWLRIRRTRPPGQSRLTGLNP